MPQKPDQLRHAWVRALRKDDIDELKAVHVCVKHFGKKTSSTSIGFPMETALFTKPRVSPKLKDGTSFSTRVPLVLFSMFYKLSHLSLDSKEDEFLNQALSLSLKSDIEEWEKFKVSCFEVIQAKL